MSDEAGWTYDEQRHEYTRAIGPCTISAWKVPNDTWAVSVDSPDSHNIIRRRFRSLEEAQAWGEAEATALNTMTQEGRQYPPRRRDAKRRDDG
jgi:hypothetical protein